PKILPALPEFEVDDADVIEGLEFRDAIPTTDTSVTLDLSLEDRRRPLPKQVGKYLSDTLGSIFRAAAVGYFETSSSGSRVGKGGRTIPTDVGFAVGIKGDPQRAIQLIREGATVSTFRTLACAPNDNRQNISITLGSVSGAAGTALPRPGAGSWARGAAGCRTGGVPRSGPPRHAPADGASSPTPASGGPTPPPRLDHRPVADRSTAPAGSLASPASTPSGTAVLPLPPPSVPADAAARP